MRIPTQPLFSAESIFTEEEKRQWRKKHTNVIHRIDEFIRKEIEAGNHMLAVGLNDPDEKDLDHNAIADHYTGRGFYVNLLTLSFTHNTLIIRWKYSERL